VPDEINPRQGAQAAKQPGPASSRWGLQPGFLLAELTAGEEGGPGNEFTSGGGGCRSKISEKWNIGYEKRRGCARPCRLI